MPFPNQIAGGIFLIIPALRSPDYIAGVSGWTINQDGTCELNETTVRGSLIVTDPDGSYVKIFDENPGNGAIVEINPAVLGGHTIVPGRIGTDLNAGLRPYVFLQSATIDGVTPGSQIQLYSDELGNQSVTVIAESPIFQGDLGGGGSGTMELRNLDIDMTNANAGGATLSVDGGITATERVYVGSIANNTTLCFEADTTYDQGPAVADTKAAAGFTDIKNAAAGTFQHTYDKAYGSSESYIEVTLSFTCFLTAVAGSGLSVQFRDSGTGSTQAGFTVLVNVLADHKCWSVTRKFTGLPAVAAGTMTVQWSRPSGTGTFNRDANDYVSITTREVGIKT